MGLSDPDHEEVRHLTYLSSQHIFSFHAVISSVDLHIVSLLRASTDIISKMSCL